MNNVTPQQAPWLRSTTKPKEVDYYSPMIFLWSIFVMATQYV